MSHGNDDYQPRPGGYQPGGYQPPPSGYQPQSGGYTPQYGGYQSGPPKPPLRSKTVWSGACVAAMSIFGYLQGQLSIQNHPGLVCALGMGVGILMIVLRFLTNQPVRPPTVTVVRKDAAK